MSVTWLNDLFLKQEELDNFIDNYRSYNGSVEEKQNALMVEIGEFLNELRVFKYWSDKEPNFENAYEEYVDGLHFILSIGNFNWNGYDHSNLQKKIEQMSIKDHELDLTDKVDKTLFINKSNLLFSNFNDLRDVYEKFENYFISYIKIGFYIGMNLDSILEQYYKKNELNFNRQIKGY